MKAKQIEGNRAQNRPIQGASSVCEAGLIHCDERKLEQPEVSVHSHLVAARLIVNSPR
jgi:hypothetical protein